jgi:arylsulfatase A-like enzyme
MRPNIVLILADDMGYGDFGAINGGLSTTPAIDQLAADGLTFRHHYSASPVCAPARAALLTGRYPQRTGVIDTLEARGTDRLALREVTLADALKAAGYRTGLVGKWHTGAIGSEYHPKRRGFDEFTGFRGGWQDYWSWNLEKGGTRMPADGRYLTDVITTESVDFIRRNAGQPFFLHVAYNAPHFPFLAPEDVVARHRREGRTETVATIYAMIEVMDNGVANIRQALAEAGAADNTLLLFTSDNGPDFGGSGAASAARFNAGLSGEKMFVTEGGIRLPLLAHWPDGMPQQAVNEDFVHMTDWFPTLLSIAGARNPGELPLDGIDLSRTLVDGVPVHEGPRFWQWTRYEPLATSNAAMRDGRWKLVRPAIAGTLELDKRDQEMDVDIKAHPDQYPAPVILPIPERQTKPLSGPLLFDLVSDPGETTDLSADNPVLTTKMNDQLTDWFESVEKERSTSHDLSRTT